MYAQINKTKMNKKTSTIQGLSQQKSEKSPIFQFENNKNLQTIQRNMAMQHINGVGENKTKMEPVQYMKRSGRMNGLNEIGTEDASIKKDFTSGLTTISVSIGKITTTLNSVTLSEDQKRYNVLETLLEDIGGNSKGHEHVTGDIDKLAIFVLVCEEIGKSVKWTGLNIDDTS